MDDPFSALKKALDSVFRSTPIRNGKYIHPEIQQLKEAVDNYQADKKKSYFELISALGSALHHLVQPQFDFSNIKNMANSLAQIHDKSDVNWDIFLSRNSRLQFHALQDSELIPWLNTTSGELFSEQKPSIQTSMLIDHSEHLGFSQKLGDQLKKDPEFLSRLIMESESNFVKIANTRLILYLTDEQIAKAIIKYLPDLEQEQQNPLTQVEQLIDKLNGILSKGRSISTLLRNVDAKAILDRSEVFQIYQSNEYKNREEYLTFTPEEEEASKPSI